MSVCVIRIVDRCVRCALSMALCGALWRSVALQWNAVCKSAGQSVAEPHQSKCSSRSGDGVI